MAGVAEEAVPWTSPIPAFQQVRAPEATGQEAQRIDDMIATPFKEDS
jgi:hypothetical protein